MEAATSSAEPATGRRARLDPLLALAALAVLCLGLMPVEIHRAFGLPAHPLLLHAPVILVPLLALALIAVAIRPMLLDRHGIALGALTVASLAATILAVGAGEAFREDRGPVPADEMHRLHDHAEAGGTLRPVMLGVTLVVLMSVAMWRARGEDGTGRLGRLAQAAWAAPVMRVLLLVGAVAAGFLVIRTGHLGAQLTWSD